MTENTIPSLHLIANTRSGRGNGPVVVETARRLCQEAGIRFVHHDTSEKGSFDRRIEAAVSAALEDQGVVAAAGGDGTIRAVAQKAHGKNVKFAVIPCGTFNFFARNHRIPEDIEAALRLALTGQTRAVRLGSVNGEVFLINASLGLYAKAIREREDRTSRWGRRRLIVILSTLMSLLEGHRLLRVDLETNKVTRQVRTPMLFIGNNALQLRNLSLNVAHCMKQDLLAVVTMKPGGIWDTIRLIFHGLIRRLENADNLESFCVDSLTIHTRRPVQSVALDGEMFHMTSPLNVISLPRVLNMVLPPLEGN
ncbi:MAG: hypothetical protein KF802_10705 [Bdellovibrionaceae bacterium]|nr:hypothetical protein [Pseudobdellovibrionaceae bacterium]MBX3034618.1 hypothetical protein [Pseudobdellovibrionaceae bacterium]